MTRVVRWWGLVWMAAIFVMAATPVAAQGMAPVRLEPVGGSNVSGAATLTAQGEGTQVRLDVTGLAAGTTARVTMQAGTCATPSASFAELPSLTADASGKATASGKVLFRETGDVALATMADSEHVIAIAGPSGVVACGVIPSLATGAPLPTTGVGSPWLASAWLLSAGLLAVGGGVWLGRRRSQSA